MKKNVFAVILLLFACTLSAQIAVKNGEKIAFLGDSITALGARKAPYMGYLHLVIDGLNRSGIKASMVPAGISGHKSTQMLARVDKDVIKKKPQWMLLSCGVNDVWHGKRGVALPDYKKNITEIVDKAQKAGIKVVIMTASMIREDAGNNLNTTLKAYNDFLRTLAKEKKCLLADINAKMQEEVYSKELSCIKGNKLTYDGVHMNGRGHMMMASVILETFGVSAAKIQQYRKDWEKKYTASRMNVLLNFEQEMRLIKKANEKGMSIEKYLASLITEAK